MLPVIGHVEKKKYKNNCTCNSPSDLAKKKKKICALVDEILLPNLMVLELQFNGDTCPKVIKRRNIILQITI